MKIEITKVAASLVLAVAATGAQAVTTHYVTNLSIVEIGTLSTLESATPSTDYCCGIYRGGIFYFGAEAGNGVRPLGSSWFTSRQGTSGGINPGPTGTLGAGQPMNSITAGVSYQGLTAEVDTIPTNGTPAGVSAVIDSDSGLVLNLDSWGWYWPGTGFDHRQVMSPDSGSLVTSFEVIGDVTYYTADWSHVVTVEEDTWGTDEFGEPRYNGFAGYRADWHLEGIATTVAVPEASTYGMMLAGLGLVWFMGRRKALSAGKRRIAHPYPRGGTVVIVAPVAL